MKPSGAHTHPDGSGGTIALAAGAVVLAAAVAGPVLAAVAELARLVVIAVAVLGGLALTGGAALAAVRLRQRRANGTTPVSFPGPVPARAAQAVPGPRPPAIEAPREVHLHFHGIGAEDVAVILARVNQEPR